MEQANSRKDAEVSVVVLENIKLRNKLKSVEQLLRQKEEFADGFHLIDYEQLKIENQTFSEKIEERDEELAKLKKKIITNVQIITHVKEKLEHTQHVTKLLKKDLLEIDSKV